MNIPKNFIGQPKIYYITNRNLGILDFKAQIPIKKIEILFSSAEKTP